MSAISFSGIGSGLPVEDIVKASVEARSQPLKRMQFEQQEAQSQISAYGKLSSRVEELRSAVSGLKGEDNFNHLQAASSNENAFTATADYDQDAVAGNYAIDVQSEASSYRWVSEETSSTEDLDGSIQITRPDGTDVTVALDNPGNLDSVREAINSHEDLEGVAYANLVNTADGQARLTVNSAETGNAQALTVDATNLTRVSDGTALQQGAAGLQQDSNLDAVITLDGIQATSATNSFSDVITGVDIEITPGASNLPATQTGGQLEVSRDDAKIKENIFAFVDAYNNVITYMNQARQPQENQNGQMVNGPLAGEGVIQSLQQELRNVIDTPASGNPNDFDSYLSHLGITTQVEIGEGSQGALNNGMLEIDQERLNKVLDEDFEGVARIMGDPDNGIAARMEQTARRMISDTVIDGQISAGLISTRQQGLQSQVSRLDNRMETTQDRLDAYEERLFRQFNSIESVTANLNAQGEQLQAQFANLPGYGGGG